MNHKHACVVGNSRQELGVIQPRPVGANIQIEVPERDKDPLAEGIDREVALNVDGQNSPVVHDLPVN